MIFQLVASVLMIITLEIYHGYTKGEPDQLAISQALENKNTAVILLYVSRFLSGWSAGKSDHHLIALTAISNKTMFFYIYI